MFIPVLMGMPWDFTPQSLVTSSTAFVLTHLSSVEINKVLSLSCCIIATSCRIASFFILSVRATDYRMSSGLFF